MHCDVRKAACVVTYGKVELGEPTLLLRTRLTGSTIDLSSTFPVAHAGRRGV